MSKNIIYLDYAATTPVLPEVARAMEPYFADTFANPGSIHVPGQESQRAIDDSRETVKNFIGASALREIIFTGSATEANNLAIFGIISRTRQQSPRNLAHIITTQIEHESVLEPCRVLEKGGLAEITYLKPDREGLISSGQVRAAIKPETILVSIGYANNEIGVIQPIAEIAKIIKESRIRNNERRKDKFIIHNSQFKIPAFHSDAAQAAQFLDMDVKRLGVDLMTISAHKIYGPKGIGALYVRDGIKLDPTVYGGGQEYGLRSGTPNVPYIAGFAKALEVLGGWKTGDGAKNIGKLREYAFEAILKKIPYASLNGSRRSRLVNNVNICFGPKTDGEALLIALAEQGICVSSGAACSARAQKPSHVIQALGKSAKEARSSIRVTLGRQTTRDEIDKFLVVLFDTAQKFCYN